MTKGAQQALRRTMEVFSATTRFALACNNSTKVIEPIQSRCAILRYTRLEDGQVAQRLQEVCRAERLAFDEGGLRALVFTAEGDLRNALNNLQSTAAGFGLVSEANVYRVCDQPHPGLARAVLLQCVRGESDAAMRGVTELWDSGYSALDIVGTLFRVARGLEEAAASEAAKLAMVQAVSGCHLRVADGCSTLVQMQGLVAKICAACAGMAGGAGGAGAGVGGGRA